MFFLESGKYFVASLYIWELGVLKYNMVFMYINTILLCTKMPRMLFFVGKIAFWVFLYITIWYLCTFVEIPCYSSKPPVLIYMEKMLFEANY